MPVLRLCELGVRLVERLADRGLHGGEVHSGAVAAAEAAHLHGVQGEGGGAGADGAGDGVAGSGGFTKVVFVMETTSSKFFKNEAFWLKSHYKSGGISNLKIMKVWGDIFFSIDL